MRAMQAELASFWFIWAVSVQAEPVQFAEFAGLFPEPTWGVNGVERSREVAIAYQSCWPVRRLIELVSPHRLSRSTRCRDLLIWNSRAILVSWSRATKSHDPYTMLTDTGSTSKWENTFSRFSSWTRPWLWCRTERSSWSADSGKLCSQDQSRPQAGTWKLRSRQWKPLTALEFGYFVDVSKPNQSLICIRLSLRFGSHPGRYIHSIYTFVFLHKIRGWFWPRRGCARSQSVCDMQKWFKSYGEPSGLTRWEDWRSSSPYVQQMNCKFKVSYWDTSHTKSRKLSRVHTGVLFVASFAAKESRLIFGQLKNGQSSKHHCLEQPRCSAVGSRWEFVDLPDLVNSLPRAFYDELPWAAVLQRS